MENSSFGEHADFWNISEIVPIKANGATSDVYKVRISGKWHFLKRPKKEYINHPLYNAAFEKEFDIGYTLDHPNIVRYISKGKDDNGVYLLTEYVDGLTLYEFISTNPNYFKKTEHLKKFIKQFLSALSYLHDKQILHLDLKPDNILITNIGKDVKIIDLGFAYTDCYQFLTTGKTNQYAAPEQINNGTIDQRTDIYGIGLILLYVFTHNSDKALLNKVPNKYRNIVRKCLENDSSNRFSNIISLEKAFYSISKRYYLKAIFISILLIFALLFIFIYSYKKETVIQRKSETHKNDTIEQPIVVYDTIVQPQQEIKKVTSPMDILKNKIKKTIDGYFVDLYTKYKSADDLQPQSNYQDARNMYLKAVSSSFELMETLCKENPDLSCKDVSLWVRTELDNNTNLYLSWIKQNSKKAEAKNDSIFERWKMQNSRDEKTKND